MSVLISDPVAWTWAPAPSVYRGYHQPIRQLMQCTDILKNLRRCCTFTMYPELTLAGNIHFHAVINVHDKIKWYRSVLPLLKRNGLICIKEITDMQGWLEYISKDRDNMLKILKIDLPLTETHVYMRGIKTVYAEASLLDFFPEESNDVV